MIPDAEFVVYIRHPLELCESNYNQGIKRHSAVNKFQVPKVIHNNTLKHLQGYFKRVPVPQFKLRPYDFKLMEGGGIVSDLLSVLGVEIKVESNNINPSFTFPALEFKRLLNHFDLSHLEPQLDQVLQACTIGEAKYSLMDEGDFVRLNLENCLLMQAFIDDNKLSELQPLHEQFKHKQQRPFKRQEASLNELTLIADYIKEVEPALYNELKLKLTNNPNLIVDNLDVYNAFSVEVLASARELLIDESLLNYINNFTIHPGKRGKVCFELSCYHYDMEDYLNALVFAKATHYFNPNHMGFKLKLNKLLIKSNELNRTSKNKLTESSGLINLNIK
ncbi:hypothetical protein ACLKMH_09435 [Psychromonas sp. KJ10-10]|uniref:hypothetical protein n=1 Tax=Psychromonas sp. KJ10-10 TaxID=3391823 RepID=UPI0039B658AF